VVICDVFTAGGGKAFYGLLSGKVKGKNIGDECLFFKKNNDDWGVVTSVILILRSSRGGKS
jgi:hypothetical protein